jgi:hypothetical protein
MLQILRPGLRSVKKLLILPPSCDRKGAVGQPLPYVRGLDFPSYRVIFAGWRRERR